MAEESKRKRKGLLPLILVGAGVAVVGAILASRDVKADSGCNRSSECSRSAGAQHVYFCQNNECKRELNYVVNPVPYINMFRGENDKAPIDCDGALEQGFQHQMTFPIGLIPINGFAIWGAMQGGRVLSSLFLNPFQCNDKIYPAVISAPNGQAVAGEKGYGFLIYCDDGNLNVSVSVFGVEPVTIFAVGFDATRGFGTGQPIGIYIADGVSNLNRQGVARLGDAPPETVNTLIDAFYDGLEFPSLS